MAISFSQSRYPHSANPHSVADGLRYQDHIVRLAAAHGIIIQQFVSAHAQLTAGESLGGYEIKLDAACTDTGRLSIEIAEKTRADRTDWTPSGIYASPPSLFYVQGNFTVAWLFATRDLVQVHRLHVRQPGKGNYQWDEAPTVRKFYLPIVDANRLALKKFVVRPDGQYDLLAREWRP